MNTPSAPIRVHTIKLVSKYRNEHIRVGQWPVVRNSFSFTFSSNRKFRSSIERNENAFGANLDAINPREQFGIEAAPVAQRELVRMKGTHHRLSARCAIEADYTLAKRSAAMR